MKPTWQERLNQMSDERVQEALRQREAYIKAKEPPIIELNSIDAEYRCVEANYYEQAIKEGKSGRGKLNGGNGYFLQYRYCNARAFSSLSEDEWSDVTDLTELKIWEYNKLVDELQMHYPNYPIERLEGRFV